MPTFAALGIRLIHMGRLDVGGRFGLHVRPPPGVRGVIVPTPGGVQARGTAKGLTLAGGGTVVITAVVPLVTSYAPCRCVRGISLRGTVVAAVRRIVMPTGAVIRPSRRVSTVSPWGRGGEVAGCRSPGASLLPWWVERGSEGLGAAPRVGPLIRGAAPSVPAAVVPVSNRVAWCAGCVAT